MKDLRDEKRVRWHLHGLNRGSVFGLARWGVRRLPDPVSRFVGFGGSWLAYRFAAASTRAIIENQRVVVPGLSERERRALALGTYRSYVREATDLFRSLSMSPAELSEFESPLTSLQHLHDDAGRGVLLVTGHLGNLELGAVLLRAVYGAKLTVVVLPEPDPDVNAERHRMRAAVGIDTVEVRNSMDGALAIRRRLAENQTVVLVCDRALGRDRVDVDFFGRPTPFLKSPAILSYLTGAPMVPTFILRQPDGRYLGLASPAIRLDHGDPLDETVRRAMQEFALVLQAKVAAYPHLWYQFYPYWEPGRPGGPPGGGRVDPGHVDP